VTGLLNLSFETSTDGTNPDDWTFSYVSSVEEFDHFVAGVLEGFESGWGVTLETQVIAGTNGAADVFTNTKGVTPILKEGFELGWSNDAWTAELTGAADAFGSPDVGGQEGFEGWSVFEPVMLSSVADLFGGQPREAFETGWRNSTYATTITGGNSTRCFFNGYLTSSAEGFEQVALDQPVAVDTSGGGTEGYLTFPNPHGFSSVFSCQVYTLDGTLPLGLFPGVKYQVVVQTSTKITFALPGVNPVSPTAQGTGVTYATDPYEFWTTTVNL
jgi:hypothetical protein